MKDRYLKANGLVFACLLSILLYAQSNNDIHSKLSPGLLRKDFSVLRDSLQKLHPGIYRYRNKTTIDHIFDSCWASIHDSMTVTDFYGLASFVIASFGDGHTNCRLPNEVIKDYISKNKVFPAMVMFIHNRAFIYCCKQNASLNGSELVSINDQPMNKITLRLCGYIQSDAFIQSHKNWELNENFPLWYNIVYGKTNSYKV
jgi:hypothetical protein